MLEDQDATPVGGSAEGTNDEVNELRARVRDLEKGTREVVLLRERTKALLEGLKTEKISLAALSAELRLSHERVLSLKHERRVGEEKIAQLRARLSQQSTSAEDPQPDRFLTERIMALKAARDADRRKIGELRTRVRLLERSGVNLEDFRLLEERIVALKLERQQMRDKVFSLRRRVQEVENAASQESGPTAVETQLQHRVNALKQERDSGREKIAALRAKILSLESSATAAQDTGFLRQRVDALKQERQDSAAKIERLRQRVRDLDKDPIATVEPMGAPVVKAVAKVVACRPVPAPAPLPNNVAGSKLLPVVKVVARPMQAFPPPATKTEAALPSPEAAPLPPPFGAPTDSGSLFEGETEESESAGACESDSDVVEPERGHVFSARDVPGIEVAAVDDDEEEGTSALDTEGDSSWDPGTAVVAPVEGDGPEIETETLGDDDDSGIEFESPDQTGPEEPEKLEELEERVDVTAPGVALLDFDEVTVPGGGYTTGGDLDEIDHLGAPPPYDAPPPYGAPVPPPYGAPVPPVSGGSSPPAAKSVKPAANEVAKPVGSAMDELLADIDELIAGSVPVDK